MTSSALSRAMDIRKKFEEKLRRRRDREELQDMLDRMQTAMLEVGREAERYYSWVGKPIPKRH